MVDDGVSAVSDNQSCECVNVDNYYDEMILRVVESDGRAKNNNFIISTARITATITFSWWR